MGIGQQEYGNDDIESIEIDIDKILSDDSVRTMDSKQKTIADQRKFNKQLSKQPKSSSHKNSSGRRNSSSQFEDTTTPRLSLGINRPIPEQMSFQESPKVMAEPPPVDIIIQKHGEDDDISTIATELFYGNGEKASKQRQKQIPNQDGHTDGTANSSDEDLQATSSIFSERIGSRWSKKYYRYACILALLLLLMIACLSVVLDNLPQGGKDDSTLDDDTRSHDNIMRQEGTPSLRPSSAPNRDTTPPTPVPTKQPSTSPSQTLTHIASMSPTMSEPGHLLHLLTYTTTEKTIQAIGSQGSPQQKAYEWLRQDPSYFSYTTISKLQRYSLAVLYYSTVKSAAAYEALETWLDYDTDECSWYTSWYNNRLPCGSDGVFKFLSLRNIALVGTIPTELALLSNLKALVMNDNFLTGTIPREIGEWQSLETLDVHGNFLSGRLPSWYNVPKLQEINLSLNLLTGPIPASMGNLNLTSLDVTENSIVGAMPFNLCNLEDQLEVLAAECNQVYCSCCTRCFSEATRAPILSPSTPPPTPSPTQARLTAVPSLQPSQRPTSMPTPVPTKQPTIAVSPTPFPTIHPTPLPTLYPTPFPTSALTLDSFCVDSVATLKRCYLVGEPITVTYTNCNPTLYDWIGLYDTEEFKDALSDPLLSQRACAIESCVGTAQMDTSALDGNSRGSYNWPLSSGRYNVFLIRGGSVVGPHSFLTESQFVTVKQDSC